MSDNRNPDERLRRLLADYAPEPSPTVWRRIQKAQGLSVESQQKNRVLFLRRTASAVAAVLVAALITFALLRPGENQSLETPIAAVTPSSSAEEIITMPNEESAAFETPQEDGKQQVEAQLVSYQPKPNVQRKAVKRERHAAAPAEGDDSLLLAGIDLFQQKRFCDALCRLEKARNHFCDNHSETVEINRLLTNINAAYNGECICMADSDAPFDAFSLCR